MFDFNSKPAITGVLAGMSLVGASATDAATMVDVYLAPGSDNSSVDEQFATYEFEFSAIDNATGFTFAADFGESSMFFEYGADPASQVGAYGAVLAKLDGAWVVLGEGPLPEVSGPGVNNITLLGENLSFTQASLSGVRLQIAPLIIAGQGFAQVTVDEFGDNFQKIVVDVVPEPTSLALLGLGGLLLTRRRR